jgi:hypothetical protein
MTFVHGSKKNAICQQAWICNPRRIGFHTATVTLEEATNSFRRGLRRFKPHRSTPPSPSCNTPAFLFDHTVTVFMRD